MGAEKKMSLKSQHNEDVYVEAWCLVVWARCSSCNNILNWFIFVTDKIDTGPIHYNWMTGWFIKSGYLILPGPVQLVGSWWSPFQIPPFNHGQGAWPHFYSIKSCMIFSDVLYGQPLRHNNIFSPARFLCLVHGVVTSWQQRQPRGY